MLGGDQASRSPPQLVAGWSRPSGLGHQGTTRCSKKIKTGAARRNGGTILLDGGGRDCLDAIPAAENPAAGIGYGPSRASVLFQHMDVAEEYFAIVWAGGLRRRRTALGNRNGAGRRVGASLWSSLPSADVLLCETLTRAEPLCGQGAGGVGAWRGRMGRIRRPEDLLMGRGRVGGGALEP